MFSVCFSARFQSCPIESYLSVVRGILRYLKWIIDLACGIQNVIILNYFIF